MNQNGPERSMNQHEIQQQMLSKVLQWAENRTFAVGLVIEKQERNATFSFIHWEDTDLLPKCEEAAKAGRFIGLIGTSVRQDGPVVPVVEHLGDEPFVIRNEDRLGLRMKQSLDDYLPEVMKRLDVQATIEAHKKLLGEK